MPSTPSPVTDEDRLAALVLLQRYKLELDQVAADALGDEPTVSLDCDILVATDAPGGASPSDLVARLGVPRSTLARGISRLRRQGLLTRSVDTVDARRAVLRPTDDGATAISRFRSTLDDWLRDSAPVVKEVTLLLGRDPEAATQASTPLSLGEVAQRIGTASAGYGRDVAEVAARHGLVETPDRYAVVHLALRESRPSLIAEHLNLTPAGTTSLLDRLQTLGHVERLVGAIPTDRRAVLVRLTPVGRTAAAACVAAFRRHEDDLLDALASTLRLAPAPVA